MSKNFNIQEYIDSGILEQYTLGLTSPQENVEIISNLQQYPALKKELTAIESSLETFASAYAQPMSEHLKSKILDKVTSNASTSNTSNTSWIQYAAILVLAGLSLYLWKNSNDDKTIIQAQIQEMNKLQERSFQDSMALVDCSSQFAYLRNKNLNRIILKGTPHSPQAIAVIYYDTISKRTLLDVVNLPEVPKDKQYQLWAIVGGKPVDLGVFDIDAKNDMKEIKFFEGAQAFAITLEPKGGLSSPTMDQMFVMGGI